VAYKKSLGVIPARMGSSRFPGKPIELICGKPMVWHIWKRAKLSGLDEVAIATCDEEIQQAAEGFGAKVVMTSDKHRGCNDRVAEAAETLKDYDVVVNIQGDEPLVHPDLIDAILEKFKKSDEILCVNPISELSERSGPVFFEISDPIGQSKPTIGSGLPASAVFGIP
jgi:3-deoxy-manno-octulosonate cytidylyltransferase (CMP-KDO synthetase)